MAGKYEKLEEMDARMKETSWKMEPGNIGNTNPGKRGANLVSQVASIFQQVKLIKDQNPSVSSKSCVVLQ